MSAVGRCISPEKMGKHSSTQTPKKSASSSSSFLSPVKSDKASAGITTPAKDIVTTPTKPPSLKPKTPYSKSKSSKPTKQHKLQSSKVISHITRKCAANVEKVYKLIKQATGAIGGNGSGGAIYGELTKNSMQKVCDILKSKCYLTCNSLFIDVGAGLGKPNFHVAQSAEVYLSYGIELEKIRWQLGNLNLRKILHASILEDHSQIAAHQPSQQDESSYDPSSIDEISGLDKENSTGRLKARPVQPKPLHTALIFSHGDITSAHTFDPFTHVYMYDIGFPPTTLHEIGAMFNRSRSCTHFISYQAPNKIVNRYGFAVQLIDRIPTSMTGSSEVHTCYFYERIGGAAMAPLRPLIPQKGQKKVEDGGAEQEKKEGKGPAVANSPPNTPPRVRRLASLSPRLGSATTMATTAGTSSAIPKSAITGDTRGMKRVSSRAVKLAQIAAGPASSYSALRGISFGNESDDSDENDENEDHEKGATDTTRVVDRSALVLVHGPPMATAYTAGIKTKPPGFTISSNQTEKESSPPTAAATAATAAEVEENNQPKPKGKPTRRKGRTRKDGKYGIGGDRSETATTEAAAGKEEEDSNWSPSNRVVPSPLRSAMLYCDPFFAPYVRLGVGSKAELLSWVENNVKLFWEGGGGGGGGESSSGSGSGSGGSSGGSSQVSLESSPGGSSRSSSTGSGGGKDIRGAVTRRGRSARTGAASSTTSTISSNNNSSNSSNSGSSRVGGKKVKAAPPTTDRGGTRTRTRARNQQEAAAAAEAAPAAAVDSGSATSN